ncbi:hypothetical protein E1212_15095 [Jiangella ureilytica]|uniref:Sulfatase N-terminal domain-containing protein n=1 Tax=Jiangella ureilytica TaxID=2530374 RepID=A0A4R4RL23_9ACTN|nr:sulfatase [Jiangella ureilytica]TDC50361.1 hypothetical protein E1212_15095 [Jiangella ureilytica]
MDTRLSRRRLVLGAAATAAAAPIGLDQTVLRAHAGDTGPSTPNILLFTVDDMGADTPGCFGGLPGITPTIDRLAADGMAFHRAHVPLAVCQPSRSALMTGRFPHRNGAEGFGPIRDDVPILTDLLRGRGYLAGILGKVTHLAPVHRFGWDLAIDQPDLGMGRDPATYARAAAGFFDRAKAEGRPFFLMANSHDPHRPFHGSAEEQRMFTPEQLATVAQPSKEYAPADVEVPGFLPDLPGVRQELSEYLSSSRRADDTLAAVLAELDAAGLADSTIVIFLSDNGIALPFAKANCYVQSTRTPLIIRWPGVARARHVDREHFVSTMDLFPLMCLAAGATPPPRLDGSDLTPLLTGSQSGRDHMVTVFHETSARRRFEMRCVQDERWGYIWNAWSDGQTSYRAENMQGLSWPAMTAAAVGDPVLAERVDFYLHREPEELYDLWNDPDALHDLAASAAVPGSAAQGALRRQRAALLGWMKDTGDPLRDRYLREILAGVPTG